MNHTIITSILYFKKQISTLIIIIINFIRVSGISKRFLKITERTFRDDTK